MVSIKQIGYTLLGGAAMAGIATWLLAANVDKPKEMKTIDGTVLSLLSPDVTGEKADAIIDAFEGDPDDANRLQINGHYGHGMEIGDFRLLKDVNGDGVIHIQDSSIFHQRDMTITPYKNASGAYVISMNGVNKIVFPSLSRPMIKATDIESFADVSDYTRLENSFNQRTLLAHQDLFGQPIGEHGFSLDDATRVVDLVNTGYVLENGNGEKIVIRTSPYGVHSKITKRQIEDGLYIGSSDSPGEFYNAYHYSHNNGMPIEDTLESMLSNPETKVVLFGETHTGNSGIRMITSMVDMLKENGYSLAIEFDPKSTNGRSETTLQEKLDAFYAGKSGTGIFDYHFDRSSLTNLILACRNAGVDVIPVEDLESVRTAYRENPNNFTRTRDHYMDQNISDYMERTGKRVAMIVGRAHASEETIKDLPGGKRWEKPFFGGFMSGMHEVIEFTYDEPKPLAERLNERYGDQAIIQIGLYDDNSLLRDPVISEGIRNNEVPEDMLTHIRHVEALKKITSGSGLVFKFEGANRLNNNGMEYGIISTDYRGPPHEAEMKY